MSSRKTKSCLMWIVTPFKAGKEGLPKVKWWLISIFFIIIITTTTEKATANIHIQSRLVRSLKHVCPEQYVILASNCNAFPLTESKFDWFTGVIWSTRQSCFTALLRKHALERCHMSNPPILLSWCERHSPSEYYYRKCPENDKYQPLLSMPDLQCLQGVNYSHHQRFLIYYKISGSRFEHRI